jgi:hypothetical protein
MILYPRLVKLLHKNSRHGIIFNWCSGIPSLNQGIREFARTLAPKDAQQYLQAWARVKKQLKRKGLQ